MQSSSFLKKFEPQVWTHLRPCNSASGNPSYGLKVVN